MRNNDSDSAHHIETMRGNKATQLNSARMTVQIIVRQSKTLRQRQLILYITMRMTVQIIV